MHSNLCAGVTRDVIINSFAESCVHAREGGVHEFGSKSPRASRQQRTRTCCVCAWFVLLYVTARGLFFPGAHVRMGAREQPQQPPHRVILRHATAGLA